MTSFANFENGLQQSNLRAQGAKGIAAILFYHGSDLQQGGITLQANMETLDSLDLGVVACRPNGIGI
jgi:ABC-type glucose/galactose transport system permease subunit